MISLKPGVKLTNLVPQMVLATVIVDHVYSFYEVKECVVTSANDGKHGDNSLHSRGGLCRACDYRTKTIPRHVLGVIVGSLKLNLGAEFDVVLEHLDEENEHLHVEYDPK